MIFFFIFEFFTFRNPLVSYSVYSDSTLLHFPSFRSFGLYSFIKELLYSRKRQRREKRKRKLRHEKKVGREGKGRMRKGGEHWILSEEEDRKGKMEEHTNNDYRLTLRNRKRTAKIKERTNEGKNERKMDERKGGGNVAPSRNSEKTVFLLTKDRWCNFVSGEGVVCLSNLMSGESVLVGMGCEYSCDENIWSVICVTSGVWILMIYSIEKIRSIIHCTEILCTNISHDGKAR